jgi:cell division protein FtsX
VPQNLQALFERALDDEPALPPGDPVQLAMAGGRRIRRRRGLLMGGSAAAAVVAAVVAVNVALAPAEPPRVPAAAGPACASPVRDNVAHVSVFLRDDATLAQVDSLRDALWTDPAVRDVRFESRQQAFEKFKRLWADSPDFVASVSAESLPQAFQVELTAPSGYRRFADRFQHWTGVEDVIGQACPGAPR